MRVTYTNGKTVDIDDADAAELVTALIAENTTLRASLDDARTTMKKALPEITRLMAEHEGMRTVVRLGRVKQIVHNADGRPYQIIEMEPR